MFAVKDSLEVGGFGEIETVGALGALLPTVTMFDATGVLSSVPSLAVQETWTVSPLAVLPDG